VQCKIEKILKKLAKLGLRPLLGVEIEFYIIGSITKKILDKIASEINLPIENEKGHCQYEIASQIFTNPLLLIDFVNITKENLIKTATKYNLDISFDPKPYNFSHGSGIHIHLSLIDKNNENIFNRCDTVDLNSLLLNSIGGVLKLLNSSLYMIISDNDNEFNRLHLSDMAPSTVSWGKNNRTTAVRIPDSHPFNRNRRIEFRVPSAQSDITNCVIFLLTSVIYGIEENVQPNSCIYGNAKDSHYNLEPLHKNASDMKKNFTFWKVFHKVCKK
jgi:glutamine synthetase